MHNITNFEYLLEINKFAGWSFNDLSSYPLIPWVGPLDLNFDPYSIRDLSRGSPNLSQEKIDHNMKTYAETLENYT